MGKKRGQVQPLTKCQAKVNPSREIGKPPAGPGLNSRRLAECREFVWMKRLMYFTNELVLTEPPTEL